MKKSKENIIYLDDFRSEENGYQSKVFTGRDRGQEVRKKSKIDTINKQYDVVTIVIPDNIYSINPSFFEELFINVVVELGKDKFLEKFKFVCEGTYPYEKTLLEAIDRILRPNNAIDDGKPSNTK